MRWPSERVEGLVSDIPLIRRAVLETAETVRHIEASQQRTTSELRAHEHSIDILNRRQLKLETDVEMLKAK
jgi:hypothetical protein